MDTWFPEVGIGNGNTYVLLADAVEQAVRAGRLKAGERLPTHREMSRRLGIAVSTVTRAYSEVARRGLVESTVGRGTFIKASAASGGAAGGLAEERRPLERMYLSLISRANAVDLSLNHPLPDGTGEALAECLAEISRSVDLEQLALYHPPQGRADHRSAGVKWLQFLGVEANAEDVIVVAGGQTALLSILLAFAGAAMSCSRNR